MKRDLFARLLGCTLTALFAVSTSVQAAPLLYGADGSGGLSSNLYIIDAATGSVVETIGPIGFSVTGLALDPMSGTLYGATGGAGANSGTLLTINRSTGAGTIVGTFGTGAPMADLAFDPSGNLYGWSQLDSDLYRIDKSSGAATRVGESGLFTLNSGLAIDAAGTVYFGGFDANVIPNLFGLAVIDPLTGAATSVVPYELPLPIGLGLTFDDAGVLYGIDKVDNLQVPRRLVTIDPATGALNVIGATVNRLDAIEFIPAQVAPEPGVLGLLLGAGAVSAMRRRRRSK
jgi:DNA-binding beta-propeller fold protein YncE